MYTLISISVKVNDNIIVHSCDIYTLCYIIIFKVKTIYHVYLTHEYGMLVLRNIFY